MTKHFALPFLLVGVFLFWPTSPANAYHSPAVHISIQAMDGKELDTFDVASANAATGVSIDAADLGDDGVEEIIIGNGLGNEPRVRVLRADGSEIGSFLAYASDMGVGINVAACDLTGDGEVEIVTVPQKNGGPHMRVFDNIGTAIDAGGTFAYAEAFRGGVNITCGDLDGFAGDELVTLPAASGGPHVRVWKWNNGALTLWQEFFAFDGSDRRGLVGDVSNQKLLVASSHGNPISVREYTLSSDVTLVHETSWQDESIATGAAQAIYINNVRHLVVEGSQHLVNLDDAAQSTVTVDNSSARIVLANIDEDTEQERIVAPGRLLYASARNDDAAERSIVVDLSDQRLYAYERDVLSNTFFISSGKYPYRTPVGNHSVLAKLPYVYYAGVDLDGTAWDLGNVPWNLRFYPKHYIHYAYWHNNFGHPMSHGCVNVSLANIKWVYDWAQVGDPVTVRE